MEIEIKDLQTQLSFIENELEAVNIMLDIVISLDQMDREIIKQKQILGRIHNGNKEILAV